MPILDALDVVDTNFAVTAAAYSTTFKDKGLAALDYANGEVIYAVSIVTTTLTDGGGNTGTDVWWADASSAAGATPAKLQKLGSFPQGAVAGAATSKIQTPLGIGLTTQQYMGFRYEPQGANLTAGKFTSAFTTDPDAWFAYAAAYTVVG